MVEKQCAQNRGAVCKMKFTVIAASNESPTSHAAAIDKTAAALPFHSKKILVSALRPKAPFDGQIVQPPEWFPVGNCDRIVSSKMMLEFMPTLVDTDYSIVCQWDGYAINPRKWTDEFLDYDYIGAPWPWVWNDQHPEWRVGCGGFSLRSHKFLQACLTLPVKETSAEDTHCCCYYHDHFTAAGCKFAPMDLAIRFALEHANPEFPNHTINDSFGFHWRGNFGKRKDLVEPSIE